MSAMSSHRRSTRTTLDSVASRPARLGLAATVLLGLAGCAEPPAPAPADRTEPTASASPNIVLVTLCTLRLSHTGLGGYHRPTTPFLDALAARGTVFETAMSASSWTKPAAARLLTGFTPNVHRLSDAYDVPDVQRGAVKPSRVLPDDTVTLAECLRAGGYDTACRVNNVNAGPFFNLTQGFDDVGALFTQPTAGMIDDLAPWLGTRPDPERPFFFLLFTRDAHHPYRPRYETFVRFAQDPPVPRERFKAWRARINRRVRDLARRGQPVPPRLQRAWVDLYDAALADLDEALARLPAVLAEAGVAHRTLIVLTADHGERFFEVGKIGHGGRRLDQAVLHVPLVFSGPGIPAGRRVRGLVRTIDLFPTLAALAGVTRPPTLQGTSLAAVLTDGGAEPPPTSAFASNGTAHAVPAGDWVLMRRATGREALFALHDDPHERSSRLHSEPERAASLRAELERWRSEEQALHAGGGRTRELSPEVVSQLEALGYL
jgi:arylsulfatase A-like enzyme